MMVQMQDPHIRVGLVGAEGGGLEPPQAHRPAVFKTAAIPVRRTLHLSAKMQRSLSSDQMPHEISGIEPQCSLALGA